MDEADVRRLARYNAWQNQLMRAAFDGLAPEALTSERGAFFGSIFATANHLLWADRMWMSRFSDIARPDGGIAGSVAQTGDLAEWAAARREMDTVILDWAGALSAGGLQGDLRWWSGASGQEQERPLAECVAHMFNHQTHHRGQIHAMLTAAGGTGWVSDLFLMPAEKTRQA